MSISGTYYGNWPIIRSIRYAASHPHYPTALFNYLASLTDNQERAWGCATGNGQAALGLARHFGEVEATDLSAGQIEQAFEDKRLRLKRRSLGFSRRIPSIW